MRKICALLLLSSIPVLALDEKPLVPAQGWEFGFRSNFDATFQLGDDTWTFYDAPSPSAPTTFGLEGILKYGMSETSDLEITLPWVYRDKDWASLTGRTRDGFSGFDRLSLAAKIQFGRTGCGVIAGFDAPVGHEQIVGFDPDWGFKGGFWGGYRKGRGSIDGLAIWSTTPGDSKGFKPGDAQKIFLNSGYQLDEGVAPQFGVLWTRQDKIPGTFTGAKIHQVLAVVPGSMLEIDEDWKLDVKVPVVVNAKNDFGTAGLSIQLIGSIEP